jgi:hypothetical protein
VEARESAAGSLPGAVSLHQPMVRSAVARALVVLILICVRPGTGWAWGPDVPVLAGPDSLDRVCLCADTEHPNRLYALLARTAPCPAGAVDSIARSVDGGEHWLPWAALAGAELGRGGLDMAQSRETLCVAEARRDVPYATLVVHRGDTTNGQPLADAIVLDSLTDVGDVSLCSGTHPGWPRPALYLAAVVDPGSGRNLFFARSLDGGSTWTDRVYFGGAEGLGRVAVASETNGDVYVLLAYVLDGRMCAAINFDCGHSEYWGQVYGDLGDAAAGARPALALWGDLAVIAWETPEGDVTYLHSQQGVYLWQSGGLLADSPDRECEPVLTPDCSGRLHLIYIDAGQAALRHRTSWSPQWLNSWTPAVRVSDEEIFAGPGACALSPLRDSTNGVGAVFLAAVSRSAYFDSDPGDASSVADRGAGADPRPIGAGPGAPSDPTSWSLVALGPQPVCPPVEFIVRCHLFTANSAIDFGANEFSIEILDISGRRVRSLRVCPGPDAFGHAGTAEVRIGWDGCEQSGRPAGQGIYFVRLSGPAGAAQPVAGSARRMLVIR